jgi:sugar phosphate isomerase/epimerase
MTLVADSGLDVLDTEVFRVTADTTSAVWNPILDMSARLGAKLINVVGVDDDMGRLTDRIGRLTEDSRAFGIIPVLEPIAYVALNSYPTAIDIARAVGCAVELDALHALRTGLNPQLVADNADLFPIFQLCDAPADLVRWGDNRPPGVSPDDSDMIIESRYNRLLPGRGDAPLIELMAALAPGTPIAMEVPNIDLQARHTVNEYIGLMHREAVEFARLTGHHLGQDGDL